MIVRHISTGQIGRIPDNKFDPRIYAPVQEGMVPPRGGQTPTPQDNGDTGSFVGNLFADAGRNIQGILRIPGTVMDLATGKANGGQFGTQMYQGLKSDIGGFAQDPLGTLYRNPVSSLLNILPGFDAVKGVSRAARAGELAETAGRVGTKLAKDVGTNTAQNEFEGAAAARPGARFVVDAAGNTRDTLDATNRGMYTPRPYNLENYRAANSGVSAARTGNQIDSFSSGLKQLNEQPATRVGRTGRGMILGQMFTAVPKKVRAGLGLDEGLTQLEKQGIVDDRATIAQKATNAQKTVDLILNSALDKLNQQGETIRIEVPLRAAETSFSQDTLALGGAKQAREATRSVQNILSDGTLGTLEKQRKLEAEAYKWSDVSSTIDHTKHDALARGYKAAAEAIGSEMDKLGANTDVLSEYLNHPELIQEVGRAVSPQFAKELSGVKNISDLRHTIMGSTRVLKAINYIDRHGLGSGNRLASMAEGGILASAGGPIASGIAALASDTAASLIRAGEDKVMQTVAPAVARTMGNPVVRGGGRLAAGTFKAGVNAAKNPLTYDVARNLPDTAAAMADQSNQDSTAQDVTPQADLASMGAGADQSNIPSESRLKQAMAMAIATNNFRGANALKMLYDMYYPGGTNATAIATKNKQVGMRNMIGQLKTLAQKAKQIGPVQGHLYDVESSYGGNYDHNTALFRSTAQTLMNLVATEVHRRGMDPKLLGPDVTISGYDTKAKIMDKLDALQNLVDEIFQFQPDTGTTAATPDTSSTAF